MRTILKHHSDHLHNLNIYVKNLTICLLLEGKSAFFIQHSFIKNATFKGKIHSSILNTVYPELGRGGCWTLSQLIWGGNQTDPRTLRQLIAGTVSGRTSIHAQVHTVTVGPSVPAHKSGISDSFKQNTTFKDKSI